MAGIRRYVISVSIVVLVVVGLLTTLFVTKLKPRLGLDLRGGLSVTLTAPDGTRPDVLDETLAILRNRVDAAGVAEPDISKEGTNNILIQLPGTDDPQRLLDLIGRTAQLQFRQVKETVVKGQPNFDQLAVTENDDAKAEAVFLADDGKTKYRLEPAVLTGDGVRDAAAILEPNSGAWNVELRFKRTGSRTWTDFTGRLACLQGPQRQVAIVLDRLVESAPQIAEDVKCSEGITGGTTQITGKFTETEAKDLALVLQTGALPVKLEQSEVRTVSPTLGRDSLRAGIAAGALGLGLVMIYVLIYYRALGLQTWIGLLVFSSIIYALVVLLGKAIGWNLTLAGIAGLIVSIGIATDSYIVFFERVKEEVHAGKTIRSSMDRGFSQAWKTLRAANGVTILAAIVLYLLAVGPVRGFALSLGMATTIDLAIFVALTWPLAALLARNNFFAEGKFIGMRRALEGRVSKSESLSLGQKIYRSEFDIDFVGRRRFWLLVSGALVVACALLLSPVRGLNFGIDFRGGAIFRAPASGDVTVAEVRDALAQAGQKTTVVQILRDPTSRRSQIQVETPEVNEQTQTTLLETVAKVAGVQTSRVDFERVGEKWGRQITQKAVRGLAIFLVLVMVYMSFRLEPKMAIAGMIALVHDVVITAGIYALVGFQVSPATVIATLTILGYSLYDTVVVFDKIRENTGMPSNSRRSFGDIANDSMNQVLMRSINTSLTTLIPVGSLLFVGSVLLGAETLKDLALAMFVGIAASTYSSIFVATPLLSYLKEKEPRYLSAKTKVVRESVTTKQLRPKVTMPLSGDGEGEMEEEEEREPALATASRPPNRPASRPPVRQGARVQQRKQSRKKRKKGRR